MKAAVIVFPGSNCDRDMKVAIEQSMGSAPAMVWHGDSELPETDLIAIPGGFSYGDYLRCGAIAGNSPIMREVVKKASEGVPVLAVCNGFQVATETGMLPGALLRNANQKFICKDVDLQVVSENERFVGSFEQGQIVRFPVAHHDGNFYADDETLKRLEGEGQVAFRYANEDGNVNDATNINGSRNNIAGIYNEAGNILGLMPHPERLISEQLGGTDGKTFFDNLINSLS
ncbi:phosphoribosylformylglycinamidine synthase subunit PurQ [Sneathiella sp. P13V-1]|uniref:phosphoribosylformylglycinamidine synthase subunit PurQ n=1 Tax=Sneathiella sp. P13V-1 TaxID=2697366 RepID=UPI00187B425B|nr:phosphoribosylformylglycinamidine synthase subunit PurQ [Sneathiella sp. P13V-1]MBE7637184.1 phosphoribosylformylglycinamidine synthase subunit PurQ [Sneathiella sp. P13V-1]